MIRVVTYNVHGGKGCDRQRDYVRIGSFLKSQEIDIALIQEFDTRPAYRSTEQDLEDLKNAHFKHVVLGPTIYGEHGWYGNLILSRFPIVKDAIIDITAKGREPRNIMEAFVATDEGLLHVLNTHKGLKRAERGLQMAKLNELLSRKSDVPLIVGGDINEWHASAVALRQLNRMLHPVMCGPTFPTFYPVFHLDRLWCRPAHVFKGAHVLKNNLTRVASDHYPLLALLKI